MAREITAYREVDGAVVKEVLSSPPRSYDDTDRLMSEGTQADRVMRGYRDLEAAGKLDRHKMKESPSLVRRVWAREQSLRFK